MVEADSVIGPLTIAEATSSITRTLDEDASLLIDQLERDLSVPEASLVKDEILEAYTAPIINQATGQDDYFGFWPPSSPNANNGMGPLPPPPGLAPLSNLAINFNNDTYRDPSVDDIIAATLSSLSTSDQVTTIELIGLLYYSLQQKSMFSSERHIEVNEFIHTLSQYWPHISPRCAPISPELTIRPLLNL